jgi:hypothetical protein
MASDDTAVTFTQYLRPHGRPVPATIERDPAIAAHARALIARGHELAIEELQDSTISMTVDALDPDDPPVAIEVCRNDASVLAAVDRLIETAFGRVCGP